MAESAERHSHAEESRSCNGKIDQGLCEHIIESGEPSQKCTDASSIMRDDAMYREAQRAIKQSTALAKLTLLAFFFMPLSITTSFFSMSLKELHLDHPLSIWVWFAVSVPLLVVSFSIMFWDVKSFSKKVGVNVTLHHPLFPNSDSGAGAAVQAGRLLIVS